MLLSELVSSSLGSVARACLLLTLSLSLSAAAEPPASTEKASVTSRSKPDYVLGVGDEFNIWVSEVDELSGKTVVVDRTGSVTLPLVGHLHVDGLTVAQLEAQLRRSLQVYVRNPEVGVSLIQTKNEAISLVGALARPGVYQLTGGGTLVDMLMTAGGLTPTAGPYAEIMRPAASGPIPLEGATKDESGKFTRVRVNARALMMLKDSKDNLVLKPGDTVSVPEAQMVYVLGEVSKPGAFPVNEADQLTALQVLAMAGGALRTAAPQNAKILRKTPGAPKPELLAVNLKDLFKGKATDFPLLPNDVVYVPTSAKKAAANRAVEAAIQTGLLALTYHVMY